MEKNLKKNIYVCVLESLCSIPKLAQHCKSTIIFKELKFKIQKLIGFQENQSKNFNSKKKFPCKVLIVQM